LRDLDLRGVAPEPLETIELSSLVQKYVHDKIDIIDQDPLRSELAFDACWTQLGCLAQLILDVGRDGLDVSVRTPMTDDEVIGDIAQAP
jgi:hypothetical protein